MRLRDFFLFLLSTASLCTGAVEARPRIDVLYLKNGDRLTCEIKHLDQGQLTVKTDYVQGDFVVNWDEIERIESPQLFQVGTEDGRVLLGTLNKPKIDSGVTVGNVVVPQAEVVNIDRDEHGILGNLDLKLNYGFNFAKSNNNTQSSLTVNADYRTDQWEAGSDTSLSFQGQDDATDTVRNQMNNDLRVRLQRNWFVGGLATFLKNTEQELELRSTLGGGLGRYFLHSNRTQFSALAGAAYTRERFSQQSGQDQQNNLEALFGVDYSLFTFDRTNFDVQVLIHPSISDWGRIRIDVNSSYSLTLWGDKLKWTIGVYDNFDSRPPTDTPNNDFGINTSIGWTIF